MTSIGFLHTASVHVATFDRLLNERLDDPSAARRHLVRPDLLDQARRNGVDEHLRHEIDTALDEFADVDVVVCTCSTISGVAERPARPGHVRVIRIDRPMAARAVSNAAASPNGTIALVTAVESATAPGFELISEEAERLGSSPSVERVFCDGAWAHFEAGELDAFLDAVAHTIDQIPRTIDVVVIAQASMAGAADRVEHPERILTSPTLAVAEAIASC